MEIGEPLGGLDGETLELDSRSAEPEQADAAAQQNRRHGKDELVEQAEREGLLGEAAAEDANVLVAGGRLRVGNGVLDVRSEADPLVPWLAGRLVRHREHRAIEVTAVYPVHAVPAIARAVV